MALQKTSQAGLPEGKTRATYILSQVLVEKIKNIAYWDRLGINEVTEKIVSDYVSKYEKKNGAIKPRPKK